jgi:hypothetical protein
MKVIDSAHAEWMALRHPFFAGKGRRGYFGNTVWMIQLPNKKPMKISGSTLETLYYISKSDGIYQPVLRGFLRSVNSLLKRGVIETTANGWTLTEIGKMVVELFKDDLFPKK